jgi:hypothetical protein
MTDSDPAQPGPDKEPATDALAAKLLAVQRLLDELDVDPDVRLRLHVRYMAICTSLKLPTANQARMALRLDQLTADAQRARGGDPLGQPHAPGGQGNHEQQPGVN